MAFTNQGTLELQNFSTVTNITDVWQRAYADSERIYHAAGGKFNAWDYQGNHLSAESFDIPAGRIGGITKVGNNIYVLYSHVVLEVVGRDRYVGRIRVYSTTGVAGTGFPVVTDSRVKSPVGLVWRTDTNVFVVAQQGTTTGFSADAPDLWVYNASGDRQDKREITPPASNQHLWNILLDQSGGVIWLLFQRFSRPTFQAYDLRYSRAPSDDLSNIVNSPYVVAFNGEYILNVTSTTTFFGDTPFEIPTPPAPPKSRRQFRGFDRYTENYDYISIAGDELTIKRRNNRSFIQTTTRDVDLSSTVTIAQQLESWTIIPQDTVPSLVIGDIIAPSVPDVAEPAIEDYPEVDRFEITGFNTTGGKEIFFQRILAERSS